MSVLNINTNIPTFIISCDDNYFDHMHCLVKSIIKFHNKKDVNIVVRGINISGCNIEIIKPVVSQLIDDRIELDTRKNILCRGIDRAHPRMKSMTSRLSSEHICYCAHSKFYNADLALRAGVDRFIVLDADTLIRGSILDVFRDLDEADLIIRHKKRTSMYNDIIPEHVPVFHEGFIAVKNNEQTTTMFKKTAHELMQLMLSKSPDYDIDSDSEVFGNIFYQLKDRLSIKNLEKKYKDTDFAPESLVWSGKGDRKFKSKRYQEQFNQYMCNV